MTKYEKIVEVLQERVDNGELSLTDAERLNDLAYQKYVIESEDFVEESADESKDLELIDKLRGLVEAGKVKLGKDDIKCIKELIEDAEDDADDKDETPDEEAEEPVDGEADTDKE